MQHPSRRSVLGAFGLTAAAALAGASTANAAPRARNATTSASMLRFGVANPGGPLASAELDRVAKIAGEKPSLLLFYKDFLQAPPIAELNAAASRGATPIVTWEPWTAGQGVDQPQYALARIAAGDFDAYLRQWGTACASWGKPVMLRFAHEMNGDWYPWCEVVNGNLPGDYVRAWRHVHDVIAGAGATNVSWLWAPNGGGVTDPALLYPGDTYVDLVGLDAYNWGTTQSWSSWRQPDAVFGPYLPALRSIAPGKKIIITETASTEAGGSKADWNTALIPYLRGQADISGFVWFDMNKETDWRIASSTASATAFAVALAARR